MLNRTVMAGCVLLGFLWMVPLAWADEPEAEAEAPAAAEAEQADPVEPDEVEADEDEPADGDETLEEEGEGEQSAVDARALDPANDALMELVVTATRNPTPLDRVGSAITILPREQMERRQDRFVLDSLRTVPGVDVRQSGWAGSQTSVFMRGTNPEHTLLRVDGIKFHDASSPANTAVFDNLTLDNVGRVEVLRGPQSTLYGSESIGGVINVITPRGEGPPSHELSLEGGSFGTIIGRASSSGGDDRFDYSLSVSHFHTDGIVTTDDADEPNAYDNTSIAGRFGYRFSEDAGVDLFTRISEADIEIDSGADPDASETDQTQYGFRIEPYAFLLDDTWETRLGIAHSEVDRRNTGENDPMFPQFPSRSTGTISQVEWKNVIALGEHTATFGLDYEHSDAEFRRPGSPDVDASAYTLGFYAQGEINPIDRLYLTLGTRADHHREFGTEFTYRAAAAYHLFEHTTVRSSYGTAFKAPTLSQLYDDSFGSANPDLAPETSKGFDIGVDQALFDERTQVSATYFRNDLDDMIVSIFTGPGFEYTNVEKARTQGLEFALDQELAPNLDARLSYTLTDTEARRAASFGISDGSRLLRRPEHKFAFDVSYSFLQERADVTLSVLYVGERDDLDPDTSATVTADDYVVLNLAGSFEVNKNVSLFARVENLTDEDYQDVLGFNTPGIGAFGGMRINF